MSPPSIARGHPGSCPGAPALNASCLCAYWGAPAQLMARVGRDRAGDLIVSELRHRGAGIDYLACERGATAPHSIIAVDDRAGERTIFNVPNLIVEEPEPAGCADSHSRPILGNLPDVILIDGYEPA